MVKKGKAYIIGAGMSGLSTACRLQELGIETIVFEKELYVGGAAASFAWREFPAIDLGPHIYHTPDKQLEEEWKKKFGDLLHEGKFWSKNVKGKAYDELYDYPLSLETIHSLPEALRATVLSELACVSEEKRLKAKTFYEYVRELVGPTLLELFFTQYPQKLWGISIHEMTANWAPKRINLTEKRMQFHANQWSAVGTYGSGAILKRMAATFVNAGGTLLLEHGVTDIQSEGNTITRVCIGQKSVDIHPEDMVVSTMPINILAQTLNIENSLRFRGAKLVFVALKKPMAIPGENCFLYYDDPAILFHRVSEQKKFCSTGFPEEKTIVTAEIAFTKGDDLDQWSDQDMCDRVVADMVKTNMLKADDVDGTKVVSLPYVYPFLSKEFEPEFVRVMSRLQTFKQLYLIGTGGEFHYADLQILYSKGKDLAERLVSAMTMEGKELGKHAMGKQFNEHVQIGTHRIGKGQSAFVIAEIGLNHNGNVNVAMELIDAAVKAGCSAVKLQTYTAEQRISKKIKANKYSEELIDIEESLFNMFKRFELSLEDHVRLFAHAREKGISIFSTPFDLDSLALLEKVGCPFYKIASMDLVNLPLIRAVAATGKPLFISTGMSTLGQIEEAVAVVRETGNQNLVLLHCVSSYPADPADMNLKVMQTLESVFHVPVGLSDHTIGLTTATVGFSLGMCAIERHFTLNRHMEGPDHILSSDPAEMGELVRLSRLVPRILGTGQKSIMGSELEALYKFKKCLYARIDIVPGKPITEDMISIKGPGGGILPKDIRQVLGRMVKTTIEADYPIMWDMLC